MSRRPPSAPPELPGFAYEGLLGSGGFADVFLYQQERPHRKVAIKVLLDDISESTSRRQFEAEANVMAHLSSHPSIVTIYSADVSAGQRPYIVMEYCPRKNYGERFRSERISVQETLSVGVQIAGAVETAHRAGILHRDIKPANILVTEYKRPALTDFGISVAAGAGEDEAQQGMSIPWSAPELFADPPRSDARSDVFSLAATLYSLLAGHTPFESIQGRNSSAELIQRIGQQPVPSLRRPDVPDELMRVLAIAMEKDPAARYDTALSFGLALQQVERMLALPVTSMDVLDDRPAAPVDEEDDALDGHTRIRRVTTVAPQALTGTSTRPGHRRPGGPEAGFPASAGSPSVAPPSGFPRTGAPGMPGIAPAIGGPAHSAGRAYDAEPVETTMLRPAGEGIPLHAQPYAGGSAAVEAQPPRRTSGLPNWVYIILAAVLVIGVGIGATITAQRLTGSDVDEQTPPPPDPTVAEAPLAPGQVDSELIEQPADGTTGGRLRVTWEAGENYDPQHDDIMIGWKDLPERYSQRYPELAVEGREYVVLTVPPDLERPCLTLRTVRDNGHTSEPVEHCPSDLA